MEVVVAPEHVVKTDDALDALKDTVYGSIAGMVGKVIEYPFDTIKVRLQSQPDDKPLQFKGPLDCFKQSLRVDGVRGLYRGVAPPIIGAAMENASLFLGYNLAQNIIRSALYSSTPIYEKLPLPVLVTCGAIGGAFTSLILTPIELVKCKMQVQALGLVEQTSKTTNSPSSRAATKGGVNTGFTTPTVRYAGPITLVAEIVKANGLKGLWRGQMGTFFRESGGSAAWFGSYEYVSNLFRQMGKKNENSAGEMMIAGAAAGVGYNFILFPADTVKSRMQTEAIGPTNKTGSFWSIGRGIYQSGGISALYRGCGITVARSAPASALIFLVFETLKAKF